MKLITSLSETVTVEFSREELRDLHDVLWDAIRSLERQPGELRELSSSLLTVATVGSEDYLGTNWSIEMFC